jgi:predicted P-loop ATPase
VTRLIDIERLQALRDSLWAEAVAAYRTEESWWLSQADERALAELAESFRSHDPWVLPPHLPNRSMARMAPSC